MNRGVSLYITVVIMAILLAIVLGTSAILMSQIKIIRGMENSVIAFHAADSGIERVLKVIIADNEAGLTGSYSSTSGEFDNGASYNVSVIPCSSADSNCNFYSGNACADISPILESAESVNCLASRYCVKSKGKYPATGGVQRAIEITYGGDLPTAVRYAYFDDPAASSITEIYGSTWGAQLFTTTSTLNNVAYVRFNIRRIGSPGSLTVSIQGVIPSGIPAFIPSGTDLCTGTILQADLPSPGVWTWRDIYLRTPLGARCDLSYDTQYAIVVKALTGNSSNSVDFRWDWWSDYADGEWLRSITSGANWSNPSPGSDLHFEVWACQ